jgi:hypothetical protein
VKLLPMYKDQYGDAEIMPVPDAEGMYKLRLRVYSENTPEEADLWESTWCHSQTVSPKASRADTCRTSVPILKLRSLHLRSCRCPPRSERRWRK